MAQYRLRTSPIEAITFEELKTFANESDESNLLDFNYKGKRFKYESDECYLIENSNGNHKFTANDMLITDELGQTYPLKVKLFKEQYEAVSQQKTAKETIELKFEELMDCLEKDNALNRHLVRQIDGKQLVLSFRRSEPQPKG